MKQLGSLKKKNMQVYMEVYFGKSGPEVMKNFSCSTRNEILNAHKCKISSNSALTFLGSDKPRMVFFLRINVKMPTIVGILTFMSRKHFMLS